MLLFFFQCSYDQACDIAASTVLQSKCPRWHKERKWRITASRFGEIILATERKDFEKLCKSMYDSCDIRTDAIIHGHAYESQAVQAFATRTGLNVMPAGLFVHLKHPFLAATPDAVGIEDYLVEVKCPYAGRKEHIQPGPFFPCLGFTDVAKTHFQLKTNHKWYFQVQGQMACARKNTCFFVMYTFADMYVEKIGFDAEFFSQIMLPKLSNFYVQHWRPFLADEIACYN